MRPCSHCVSGNTACDTECGGAFTGLLTDNILSTLPGLDNELECRYRCQSEGGCSAFTYFSESDPALPRVCFLLSHQRPPYQPCPYCVSGPPSCQSNYTSLCTITEGWWWGDHMLDQVCRHPHLLVTHVEVRVSQGEAALLGDWEEN